MIKKTINFDKFLAEKEREQIKVMFRGREYVIASEIPAFAPIMLARGEQMNQSDGTAQVVIFKAIDSIFGKEAVDQMCADGASAKELIQLMQKIFAVINGVDDDDSEELSDEDSVRAANKGNGKK